MAERRRVVRPIRQGVPGAEGRRPTRCADPKGHAAGTKTGDVIHIFQSGAIQMITDVGIDPAGNVWAANNWNDLDAVVAKDPPAPISTKGGGQGIVVIYGIAAPVKTPLMGSVRQP